MKSWKYRVMPRPARTRLPALLLAVLLSACMASGTRELPLTLESMGVFHVGGTRVDSPYADERDSRFPTSGRSTVAGQARITYLIPQHRTGAPIVLIPGFGLSSSIYLSTPDGREGWAQYFARRGFPVYVMDIPDRSTSGFAVDAINGCILGDPAFPCTDGVMLGKTSLEQPWSVWGFGPSFGERYPDSRFPALPLQQNYIEQFAASFEVFTGSGNMGRAQPGGAAGGLALEALLERIGPSVLVLHSAAGATGFGVARLNPALALAMVSIETTACPDLQSEASGAMRDIPFLGIYGDYVAERTSGGHPGRHAACKAFAESAARRAPGTFIDLPADLDIRGNSHLMMQDDNSDALAEMIADWIAGIDR